MAAKWITSPVTFGKLRVFPVTAEGNYPISGRLECEMQITLLLHHAGIDEDLSGLQQPSLRAFSMDPEHGDNWVRIGPMLVPPDSPWPDPKDIWEMSAALFMPPPGSWWGYDLEASLKVAKRERPINFQIRDRDWPHSLFAAVAARADTMLLVHILDQDETGRLKGTRLEFKRAEDFELWVASQPLFGELLTTPSA
jgi:hypothetical protein